MNYERAHQPRPKLGPWQDELEQQLSANEAKPHRDRQTLIRIFEELREQGFKGGYDSVRRYAKSWRRKQASMTTPAFVPLSFAPGEAYQFDWSHEIVVINGVTIRVKVAHVRLCHSRMLFVRAYPRESQEMVFRPWPSPPYQVFCRAHARGARHLSCEASAGVRRWIRSSSAASSTRDDGWMPQPTRGAAKLAAVRVSTSKSVAPKSLGLQLAWLRKSR